VVASQTAELMSKVTTSVSFWMNDLSKSAIQVSQDFTDLSTVWQALIQMNNTKDVTFSSISKIWTDAFAEIAKGAKEAKHQIDILDGVGVTQSNAAGKGSLPVNLRGDGSLIKKKLMPPLGLGGGAGGGIDAGEDPWKKMQDSALSFFNATRTPLEKYNEAMIKLKELNNAGLFKDHPETFARANAAAWEEYVNAAADAANQNNVVADSFDAIQQVSDTVKNTLNSMFDDALNGSFNLQKSLTGLLKSLASNAWQQAVTMFMQPSHPLYGGGGGGFSNILGSLFGGFRADGGAVSSGRSYVVGERGPELFTPGSSGHITPNGGSGGMKVIVNNYAGAQVETSQDSSGAPVINIGKMLEDKLEGQYGLKKVQNRRN
jgi:hypothetical protein